MQELIQLLHESGCSCVIRNGATTRTFHERGVKDLLNLYEAEPQFLNGASIADKVVGKGAAALMVLGGLREVYADTLSSPALTLLRSAGIDVSHSTLTERIMNRRKDGLCPVETLCLDLSDPKEMYIRIKEFITSMQK